MSDAVPCPLCRADAKLLNANHPGYQRPQVFAIYGCAYCDLQFAWPMRTEAALVEPIPRRAARPPGYDTTPQASLDWLATQGAAYWFIREAMRAKRPLPAPDAPVVEIGSGFGHLTHALALAGYDATGIDGSATAVAEAIARFGERYVHADVNDYVARYPASASVAVAIDVLERVPDPGAMLTAIRKLLKPGGIALVTTPNKSVHRATDYWETDNPPLHLWWLSETSVRRLARATGFEIELWDFTGFNRPGAERQAPPRRPMTPPMLDERGEPIAGSKPIVGNGKALPASRLAALRDRLVAAATRFDQWRRRRAARQRWADEHGDTMGIVLTRPAE